MNDPSVPQDFLYALTQVAHNFGAMAVSGGAILARWPVQQDESMRRRLAWWVLAGWLLQALTGATMGAISVAFYGAFPDIQGIALAALLIKMACAAIGFVLAALYLKYTPGWSAQRQMAVWNGMIVLAATALTAAAFLRWFA